MDARSDLGKYGAERHESDFGHTQNPQETLAFSLPSQAQSGARDCAYPEAPVPPRSSEQSPLGEPLAIEQVAELLGCSAWTVRQRYLRQGLPHLQARPRGKLVFFREQVIAWTLKRQRQKGGILR